MAKHYVDICRGMFDKLKSNLFDVVQDQDLVVEILEHNSSSSYRVHILNIYISTKYVLALFCLKYKLMPILVLTHSSDIHIDSRMCLYSFR
jgi:hypothetical protein